MTAEPNTAKTKHRWELSILIGPCPDEAAEEFLLALQHKFGDHLGASYSMTPWDKADPTWGPDHPSYDEMGQ